MHIFHSILHILFHLRHLMSLFAIGSAIIFAVVFGSILSALLDPADPNPEYRSTRPEWYLPGGICNPTLESLNPAPGCFVNSFGSTMWGTVGYISPEWCFIFTGFLGLFIGAVIAADLRRKASAQQS
jgi:hypothetical protein